MIFADMKNLSQIIILTFLFVTGLSGQSESGVSEGKYDFNTGLSIYSSCIWRGLKIGQGPHFQPEMEFTAGGLVIGVWGTVDLNGYTEADTYLTYTFPSGLSFGVLDYYITSLPFRDVSVETGSHVFEINCNYTKGGLNISTNFILNEAGGAGSAGKDLYFEAAYSFTRFNIFTGAGNGWHTSDGGFNICNIGLDTDKTLDITDRFSILLKGQVIFNPDSDHLYIVAGICF